MDKENIRKCVRNRNNIVYSKYKIKYIIFQPTKTDNYTIKIMINLAVPTRKTYITYIKQTGKVNALKYQAG